MSYTELGICPIPGMQNQTYDSAVGEYVHSAFVCATPSKEQMMNQDKSQNLNNDLQNSPQASNSRNPDLNQNQNRSSNQSKNESPSASNRPNDPKRSKSEELNIRNNNKQQNNDRQSFRDDDE